MVNLEIREEIAKSRIRMWEIADKLRVTDSNLSRILRKELTDEQKNEIRDIIKIIRQEA